MDHFVTIATFTYPHEANVIMGRLQSEGIECFLKDELTAQVNNFYSNAIGGVKLQVRETDVDQAMEILAECGYQQANENHDGGYWLVLDHLTNRLPLLRGMRVEFRLLAIIGISVFVFMVVGYFITQPG